ncbi:Gfo/Idh/MocA family protein [Sphingomonas solaris]|nr:Gfo/Idh/MocA family oxidoreductase [Sphingomonas solaris]
MASVLRVGIIGANLQGSWGVGAHLPALAALDTVRAVAVATTREETARATADAFGIPHAFGDPHALIAHPDVDAVAVCVRVPAHRDLVLAAIAAGKHVYCEWPLARDTAEARDLLSAARAAGVVHMVGLQSRSAPVLAHARALIASGAIGTPRSAALTHSSDWISAVYPGTEYLQDRASGAHFLSIPGGHSVDALTWLLGGDFARLQAVVQTGLRDLTAMATGAPLTRTSADQVLVAGVLENGVVASVRLSGASSPGTGVWLEVSGDSGDLVIQGPPGARGIQMTDLTLYRTSATGELEPVEIPADAWRTPATLRNNPPMNVGAAWLHFADAVARGTPATPGFAEAVRLHELLDGIEAAARS